MPTPSALLNVMIDAARKAARGLARDFGEVTELQVSKKGAADFVSNADLKAEQTLFEILTKARPGYGFLGEERGMVEGTDKTHTWIVDPLDGTTNFLHDIPHYAVSIALIAHAGTSMSANQTLADDTPVIGVVYDPSREELFTGVYGVGAWLNGRRISCSRTQTIEDAVLATGFPFRDFSFAAQYMPMLHDAINRARGVRRMGAAALDLAWTACGRYDGYWEMGLAPWDVAAGTLILREAGGACSDMHQQDPWPIGGRVVAGNPDIERALHAMIAPHLDQPD